MTRQELAKNLVSAKNEKDRKDLLENDKSQADVKLAWKIKEICYESWTNEPVIAQQTAAVLKTLANINLDEEIKAISHWIMGIAELTKGNLEKAIDNLEKSSEIFEPINKYHESAQTKVAKLVPLGLLGKYDEAIKTGEKALIEFENFGDKLAAGKVEMNLSNIVSRRGEHRKAEKYCESALKKFIEIEEKEWQAMAENGMANTYSELNDFRKAAKFYSKALRTAKSAKMLVTEAEIEASLGNLETFRGNYSEALNYLEISRRKFQELKMPHQTAIANLEIAEIYQILNLNEESYDIYEKVSETFRRLKLRSEEAKTRKNLGKILIKHHNFENARKELQKSSKLYLEEKTLGGAASVKMSEATLELTNNEYQTALKKTHEAKKLLRKSEDLRQKLQANFLHGEILRKLNKFKVSEKLLSKTYDNALENEQKMLAQNCLNSLGSLALQKDETVKAENYFKKSIEMFENVRSPLPAEEFRMAFLADNLLPFENLAKLYLEKNEIEKAFVYIEKAKSRSLADAIGAIKNRKSKTNKQASKLNTELKKLREELNWFYSRLSRAKESEIENIQKEIKSLEQKTAEKTRQINSTSKSDFNHKNDEISLNNLQTTLGDNQVLVEYIKFGEYISAFVITNKKIDFVRNFAKELEIVSLIESLQFQFGALRYGKNFAGKFEKNLKKKADYYLQKLYEKLIAPLANFIEKKDLVIIPVSSLFYIPFCGLFDGNKYVIEEKKITISPSALVWNLLNKKENKTFLTNGLIIGFADKNIPLVNQEIDTLKKIIPKVKSFSGKDATFTNYKNNAEEKDLLHMACHGQFRPDNPLFSSLHLADGFVTVRDICSQNLDAELVTLSACETGINKIHAGDEILGLARGFLTAGVRTLVLSLWTVNDEATQELMKDFYTEVQKGKSISTSLQKAQKNFINKEKHPYFWASFGIIGK